MWIELCRIESRAAKIPGVTQETIWPRLGLAQRAVSTGLTGSGTEGRRQRRKGGP